MLTGTRAVCDETFVMHGSSAWNASINTFNPPERQVGDSRLEEHALNRVYLIPRKVSEVEFNSGIWGHLSQETAAHVPDLPAEKWRRTARERKRRDEKDGASTSAASRQLAQLWCRRVDLVSHIDSTVEPKGAPEPRGRRSVERLDHFFLARLPTKKCKLQSDSFYLALNEKRRAVVVRPPAIVRVSSASAACLPPCWVTRFHHMHTMALCITLARKTCSPDSEENAHVNASKNSQAQRRRRASMGEDVAGIAPTDDSDGDGDKRCTPYVSVLMAAVFPAHLVRLRRKCTSTPSRTHMLRRPRADFRHHSVRGNRVQRTLLEGSAALNERTRREATAVATGSSSSVSPDGASPTRAPDTTTMRSIAKLRRRAARRMASRESGTQRQELGYGTSDRGTTPIAPVLAEMSATTTSAGSPLRDVLSLSPDHACVFGAQQDPDHRNAMCTCTFCTPYFLAPRLRAALPITSRARSYAGKLIRYLTASTFHHDPAPAHNGPASCASLGSPSNGLEDWTRNTCGMASLPSYANRTRSHVLIAAKPSCRAHTGLSHTTESELRLTYVKCKLQNIKDLELPQAQIGVPIQVKIQAFVVVLWGRDHLNFKPKIQILATFEVDGWRAHSDGKASTSCRSPDEPVHICAVDVDAIDLRMTGVVQGHAAASRMTALEAARTPMARNNDRPSSKAGGQPAPTQALDAVTASRDALKRVA
ncbi:hypothetical protein C8R45DRAFT_948377 [Mycena sanguinolenta]|nr:hypothetical protein C8R45DRAFT_948377 [Mycena sanguinolenta]